MNDTTKSKAEAFGAEFSAFRIIGKIVRRYEVKPSRLRIMMKDESDDKYLINSKVSRTNFPLGTLSIALGNFPHFPTDDLLEYFLCWF